MTFPLFLSVFLAGSASVRAVHGEWWSVLTDVLIATTMLATHLRRTR